MPHCNTLTKRLGEYFKQNPARFQPMFYINVTFFFCFKVPLKTAFFIFLYFCVYIPFMTFFSIFNQAGCFPSDDNKSDLFFSLFFFYLMKVNIK